MNQSRNSLEQIFETHIQTLALTLRPGTVRHYRCTARRFLAHLRCKLLLGGLTLMYWELKG